MWPCTSARLALAHHMSSARHLVRVASASVGVLAYLNTDDISGTIHQTTACAASNNSEKQLAELTSTVAQLSSKLDKVLELQAPPVLRRQNTNVSATPIIPPPPANSRVTRVVLTGGPCGGKSSCLSTVEQHLKDLGFNVYIVPEASTMLKTSGYGFPGEPGTSRATQLAWEERKMRLQIMLEDLFAQIGSQSM